MRPYPICEIFNAGSAASSISIADYILAISALGALIISICIGIKQNRATHATVNRQIVQQWIHDFTHALSSLKSLVASVPALLNTSTVFPMSPDLRERYEKISYLSDKLLLILDIRDEKQPNYRNLFKKYKNLLDIAPKVKAMVKSEVKCLANYSYYLKL